MFRVFILRFFFFGKYKNGVLLGATTKKTLHGLIFNTKTCVLCVVSMLYERFEQYKGTQPIQYTLIHTTRDMRVFDGRL